MNPARARFPWPALVLFLLAPTLPELVTGNMPPHMFFGLSFVVFPMYGLGVVLVRETIARWHKGWASLLVLGFAYGLCEEGIMLKTCVDPNVGGGYGRWAGVNWPWTLAMNLWHSLYSVAIPIVLVYLIFPHRRKDPWLSRAWFLLLAAAFVVVTVFVATVVAGHIPPTFPFYPLIPVAVLLLILVAYILPRRLFRLRLPASRPYRPLLFWLFGLLFTPGFYLVEIFVRGAGAPPIVTMLAMGLYFAAAIWTVTAMSGYGAWNAWHQFALSLGAYSLYILCAPVAPAWTYLATRKAEYVVSMSVVGLLAVVFFVWLGRRMRRYTTDDLAPIFADDGRAAGHAAPPSSG